MAKYIYKFDYSIMANSALKVWAEESPEIKHLFIVPGFKTIIAGELSKDEARLISMIKLKFNIDEVEVEEYDS